MTKKSKSGINRREHLIAMASLLGLGNLPPSILRALEIEADKKTGTINDIEHIVILMQENRAFDHYFGSLNGVCGFGDPYPIPVADKGNRKSKSVWAQFEENSDSAQIVFPFHLNTKQKFKVMRHPSTPHTFPDAQNAWNDGRLDDWTKYKRNYSMGYFKREDIPFQFALAETFTICDAYHCSMHAGTNPNRVYHWTGTINPDGTKNGPVLDNAYDRLSADYYGHGGYDWTTYPERLQAAGINWQIYQDTDDNFSDNPLEGFKTYRAAAKANSSLLQKLALKSLTTRNLDKLKEDVLAGVLPQVSWIIGTKAGSEHPDPSSPAQGADYIASVLDALTSNPKIWAKTVFIVNFDENDGLFDHVPPPAPPALDDNNQPLGHCDVETMDEYHIKGKNFLKRAYGLGPRVPMYVISPWSKGGYVNSEVFDHTSVIKFIEKRFGVQEPNISPWRRAVCGDLTSCFDFINTDTSQFFKDFPPTSQLAQMAKALKIHTIPRPPKNPAAPFQEKGLRKRRQIDYNFDCNIISKNGQSSLKFSNLSIRNAAVFHSYDRKNLNEIPRRYTLNAKSEYQEILLNPEIDIWIRGSNGFHRHFIGAANGLKIDMILGELTFTNLNQADEEIIFENFFTGQSEKISIPSNSVVGKSLVLDSSHNWYDFKIKGEGFTYHYGGHVENEKPSWSNPLAHGQAIIAQA